MAGSSFEEQVRAELRELQMSPDAAVWPAIEAALRKEQKRRFIWFFLLAGIGLTGAGFYMQYGKACKQDTALLSPVKPSSNPAAAQKSRGIDSKDAAGKNDTVTVEKNNRPSQPQPGEHPANQTAQKLNQAISLIGEKPGENDLHQKAGKKQKQINPVTENQTQTETIASIPVSIPVKERPVSSISQQEAKEEKSPEQITKPQIITEEKKAVVENLTKESLSKDTAQQFPVQAEISPAEKEVKPAKKKWQWSLHGSFGSGNTIDALLPGQKTQSFVYGNVSVPVSYFTSPSPRD